MEIFDSIERDVYKKYYILHPVYAIDGRIDVEKIKNNNKEKILSLDRNVLSSLFSAVKKGSFDGPNRKALTALLIYGTLLNCYFCPYDAIKEQAYPKRDNKSGNKENDLFNFVFDEISFDIIMNAYFTDGVVFKKKSFADASEIQKIDFCMNTADLNFLYATILHFAYVLRTEKNKDKQFEVLLKWYFENALVSGYTLTYILNYFTANGITPPHNVFNDNKVLEGCINQAMDLYYIQELDPNRIPSDNHTFMFVTSDKVLATVFGKFHKANASCNDANAFFDLLCDDLSRTKKAKCISFLNEYYNKRKYIGVKPTNALSISQELVKQEESLLKTTIHVA